MEDLNNEPIEIETDVLTQSVLLAAANHDVAALRDLLRNTSANVQDAETGYTPLHAAIAACAPSDDDGQEDGVTKDEATREAERKRELEKAAETVRYLFQNGAIWNDLDKDNETPGCLADRLGLKELYDLVVDAGVRAELLLGRLDEYQMLGGDDESDEDEDEGEEGHGEDGDIEIIEAADLEATEEGPTTEDSGVLVPDPSANNPDYLKAPLTFTPTRLLDAGDNGVMMDWETDLMKRSAALLCPRDGLRVLNIGHGMGIIDGCFQAARPAAHHIIEAHPDVLAQMTAQGWSAKPRVVVHAGRWQDVVPRLVEQGALFDAIYFDTFAEDYKALREFFTEYVIGLLDPAGGPDGDGGRFGFFNGMGADRKVCYDVYNKIVEMDLFEAGFDVEWETVPVPDLKENKEWDGVRRAYWALDTYRLPTCKFIG